jgi:hypothetical protein
MDNDLGFQLFTKFRNALLYLSFRSLAKTKSRNIAKVQKRSY